MLITDAFDAQELATYERIADDVEVTAERKRHLFTLCHYPGWLSNWRARKLKFESGYARVRENMFICFACGFPYVV